MVDSESEKKRLSFKDALINKYSLDEDEELCFIQTIHISGSPKHKGEIRELQVSYYQIESECCFKEKHRVSFLTVEALNCSHMTKNSWRLQLLSSQWEN